MLLIPALKGQPQTSPGQRPGTNLRSADFDKDRLTSPSGIKVPGVRSLSYFIAHEIAHTMVADQVGSFAYVRLPDWKNEGYCDYVAKGGAFSFDDAPAIQSSIQPALAYISVITSSWPTFWIRKASALATSSKEPSIRPQSSASC